MSALLIFDQWCALFRNLFSFNETIPLRAGPEYWNFGISGEDVCALTLLTDGLYDIVKPWQLKDEDQQIYVNFVRPFMDINVLKVSTPEDFEAAQAEMIEFFRGPYTRQISDDKIIVGLINTDVVPGIKPEEFYREPDWEALKREHDDRLYETESRQ